MATTTAQLQAALQRRVGEFSRYIGNETLGTGDGSATIFYMRLPPIASSSYTIYVADVAQTETTHYTIDLNYGRVTFVAAPSNGSRVSADYKGLSFHTGDLDNIISEAVQDLELWYKDNSFVIASGAVSPVPTSAEERLLVQQCVVNMLDSLAAQVSMDSIRTAQTGFSFDISSRPNALIRLAEMQQARLEKMAIKLTNYLGYADDDTLVY